MCCIFEYIVTSIAYQNGCKYEKIPNSNGHLMSFWGFVLCCMRSHTCDVRVPTRVCDVLNGQFCPIWLLWRQHSQQLSTTYSNLFIDPFFFYSSHSSYFLSPHYWPIPPVIYFSKTDGRTCSTVRVSDWCGRSAEVKAHPETDKLNCSFCSCVLLTRHWHGAEGSRAHSFMHNAYVY